MSTTYDRLIAHSEEQLIKTAKELELEFPFDKDGKLIISKEELVRFMMGEECTLCEQAAAQNALSNKSHGATVVKNGKPPAPCKTCPQ